MGVENVNSISVVIVDDMKICIDGIKSNLMNSRRDISPKIDITGIATGGYEAFRLVLSKKPDVVLLDYQLPDLSGLDVLNRLKEKLPNTKVIFCTQMLDKNLLVQLFNSKADGLITKDTTFDIADAIHCVHCGQNYIQPDIGKLLLDHMVNHNDYLALKDRDRTIHARYTNGETAEQLAQVYQISPKRVRNIVSKINVIQKRSKISIH